MRNEAASPASIDDPSNSTLLQCNNCYSKDELHLNAAVLKMVYTLTVHLYTNNHPDSIPRLKAKLVEAARIYRKDRETVDWFVMQDVHDPRAFTIVERFETEAVGSQALEYLFER
jgi:hypothetical protein